jgi:hypothetical protein
VNKVVARAFLGSDRLVANNIELLQVGGAVSYCWVAPDELTGCPFGGFIYHIISDSGGGGDADNDRAGAATEISASKGGAGVQEDLMLLFPCDVAR